MIVKKEVRAPPSYQLALRWRRQAYDEPSWRDHLRGFGRRSQHPYDQQDDGETEAVRPTMACSEAYWNKTIAITLNEIYRDRPKYHMRQCVCVRKPTD